MIILDTNVLIEVEDDNLNVINKIKEITKRRPSKPFITSPTYSEFLYGYQRENSKVKEAAQVILNDYSLLNSTKSSSRILAETKYKLEKKGKMIPLINILIAAIVLDHDGTLVTMDKHFKNVEGLSIEFIDQT
jgi:predicted nucleic acid-binding protein